MREEQPHLKIIQSAPRMHFQDLGRYGYAHLGISHGGPIDLHAHCWANFLLENDTDPNEDVITIVSVETPQNGTAELNDEGTEVLYTPIENFVGEDTFAYVVSDTKGLTAMADVTVTVKEANQAPIVSIVTDVINGPAALSVNFDGSESILGSVGVFYKKSTSV